MTTPDALAALQSSLSAAVKASSRLPKAQRPAFIGQQLLAEAAGEASAEDAITGGPSELPASERAELAAIIEKAVNSAEGKHGWPLRAIGEALCGPTKDKVEERLITDPSTDSPAVASAKAVFAAVDKDSSGFVDKNELLAHVIAHVISQGLVPTPDQAQDMTTQLFQTIDADKDGRIAVDEWVRVFAASELQRQQGRGAQAFEG